MNILKKLYIWASALKMYIDMLASVVFYVVLRNVVSLTSEKLGILSSAYSFVVFFNEFFFQWCFLIYV